MRSIRGGKGLGDAIYVQSVARHLTAGGERLRVLTFWPDVFKPLNGSVTTAPFTREGQNIIAHYMGRRGTPGTSQFEDCCISAGIKGDVELRLDWKALNTDLLADLREQAAGRPIVLVQMMRQPMDRKMLAPSLLPDGAAVQAVIDRLRPRAFIIQIGAGQCLYELRGIDVDLAGGSVSDMLDVATIADGFVGYSSFIVPLAESVGKPLFLVWSSKGLRDPKPFVRQVTPEKVVHRDDLAVNVRDDQPLQEIAEAADAFLR